LEYFLSFAHGYWVEPLLPVGFATDRSELWREWNASLTEERQGCVSWLPYDESGILSSLFPRFAALWDSGIWGEPLRLAIYWYIQANKPVRSVETALMLEQVALELLAWVLVVEQRKSVEAATFDSMRAADRLRALLKWCGIPPDVPRELADLDGLAKELGAVDGPHVLSDVRNKLVHPKPDRKRKIVLGASPRVMLEAWELGMWYLELALLRVLGHKGHYVSRIHPKVRASVPWAQPGV
jgi:hypothetical protein